MPASWMVQCYLSLSEASYQYVPLITIVIARQRFFSWVKSAIAPDMLGQLTGKDWVEMAYKFIKNQNTII